MRIAFSDEEIVKEDCASIFLAGPTKRDSTFDKSWRKEACTILEEIGFDGVVYVPEYGKGKFKGSVEKQSMWEWSCLDYCDVILFWVPRKLKEDMPAFTTNVEFGMYIEKRPHNVVYAHPIDAEKMKYLDLLWKDKIGYHIENDLRTALEKAKEMSEYIARKRTINVQ